VSNLQAALDSAKTLSVNERALLAHTLISSLETIHDDGVDESWAKIAKDRFEEIKAGKVKGVSWEKIKGNIAQK
jgi:putative addiction module component (TIGR02574 family)